MAVLKAMQPAPDEPSMRQRTAPRQMLNLSQWRGLSHTIAGSRGQTPRVAELFLFYSKAVADGVFDALSSTWKHENRWDGVHDSKNRTA